MPAGPALHSGNRACLHAWHHHHVTRVLIPSVSAEPERARSTGGGRGVGRALENDTEGGAEGESGAEGCAVSQPKSACPAENVGDEWSENKTS